MSFSKIFSKAIFDKSAPILFGITGVIYGTIRTTKSCTIYTIHDAIDYHNKSVDAKKAKALKVCDDVKNLETKKDEKYDLATMENNRKTTTWVDWLDKKQKCLHQLSEVADINEQIFELNKKVQSLNNCEYIENFEVPKTFMMFPQHNFSENLVINCVFWGSLFSGVGATIPIISVSVLTFYGIYQYNSA